MTKLQTLVTLLMVAIAPAVSAHPGHPTFGPVHSYGETELGAIALILVVVIALGAIGVRRGPRRLRDRLTRFRKD